MDALGPVVEATYRTFGVSGLLLVCACALGGTCIAQLIAIRRFSSSVAAIIAQQVSTIDRIAVVVSNQDRAHEQCREHYKIVHEQVESMRGLSYELRAVGETFHKYHLETSLKLVELFHRQSRATD
jgi:uncharacterized coiled-coil protein SlyX